jgi:hypothetical protein
MIFVEKKNLNKILGLRQKLSIKPDEFTLPPTKFENFAS